MNIQSGESAITAVLFLVMVMVVGIGGFIYLSSVFTEKYTAINEDIGNNTGIISNGSEYEFVRSTGESVATTSPVFVYLALLFGCLALIGVIYAIMRR